MLCTWDCFFIVGAVARNIWLASHGETTSGTKDIDFAVFIPDKEKYNELIDVLIKKHLYKKSKTNAFCLITTDGIPVDLLPFGEIEKEGNVLIDGVGLSSINLEGFKESSKFGLEEVIIGSYKFYVSSIPAVVMLKLVAYDDRPENRIKDVKNINEICLNYPNIESEYIWRKYFYLYTDELSHQDVAMQVLGMEIKKIINTNRKLKKRILHILDKAINQHSKLIIHMIENSEKETIEMKSQILQNIKIGIIS
ncbi:MAG: hypothetical protein K8R79_08980 [Calditrichales bacterium]|nr:hypothetical protein [Calditrichales bacterium]